MTDKASFRSGVLVGLLAMIGAQAIHWLITPANHPDASSMRTTAVVIQAIGAFGVAIWIAFRRSARVIGHGR
jgi:hypothetical protein